MLELLKKIGIPASVAAMVALLVTVIPLVFKFDARYAKDDDLNELNVQVSKQISDLTVEVGQLAGTTQVLVTILAAQAKAGPAAIIPAAPAPVATPPAPAPVKTEPARVPVVLDNLPPTAAGSSVQDRLEQVSRRLELTQQKVQQMTDEKAAKKAAKAARVAAQ